jgi:hypothetical protein
MFIQTDKNVQYLYDLVETNDCCHKSTKITEYPYSFAAMMKNSFSSVKSFGFRYRLNLAIERADELGSCFISVGHKRRFCDGLSALGVSSNLVAAQLFLLSANVRLWHKVKPYLISGKIAYPFIELALQDVSDKEHSLYLAAKDLLPHRLSVRFLFLAETQTPLPQKLLLHRQRQTAACILITLRGTP